MSQFERYIGKKLDGRYELREIVGIGGMAVVYCAYDLQEKRTVAVKLLRDEYLANDEFRRRFKIETKAISMLSHENIVQVYDVCLGDRLQYIVMEYVDGVTLKEYIEKKKVLPESEAVLFLTQILRALGHAHEKGIVHRDVKPQNIMLTASGLIKVTDFGIARFIRSSTDTMTTRAIGSVHYVSPEQARGDAVDARADIYSVGVMMYEMLTGRLPFESDNPVQVALMQMQAEAPAPRSINPGISPALEEICGKAMRKLPAERYAAAGQMLAALEEARRNPSKSFGYKYGEAATGEEKGRAGRGPERAKRAPKPGKTRRYKSRWLGLLFAITLSTLVGTGVFVVVAVLLKTTLLTPAGAEVDLPNFVGLSYYDVIKDEYYSTFDIEYDSDSRTNDSYATGVIYEQSPSPPKKVVVGSKIKVKVSKGPSLVPLPDYSGREKSAALTAIGRLGLTARVVERFAGDAPAGYVLSTDPGPGTEIPIGTCVTVYVGIGDSTRAVQIPFEVRGSTVSETEKLLAELGLRAGTVIHAASAMPAETVMSTDPAPGEYVVSGSTVNIVVSNGAYYIDTTRKMTILLKDLPQRSFSYLLEVYLDQTLAPIAEGVIAPGCDSFSFSIEIRDGTDSLLVKANDQVLRDVTVDYDEEDYFQRGVDYAVDLSPGYVTEETRPYSASSSGGGSVFYPGISPTLPSMLPGTP